MTKPHFFVDLSVRSTELANDRTVPMTVFFRYFEHLRLELGLDPRFGLRPFWHAGNFFVVRDQHIALLERVCMQQRLRLYIWVKKVGRVQVIMGQEAHDRDTGNIIARSEVSVLWMNQQRRLTRIPNVAREAVRSVSQLPPTPEKITVVRQTAENSVISPPLVTYTDESDLIMPFQEESEDFFEQNVLVRPSDIDLYNHVNAAGYVAFCEDARLNKLPKTQKNDSDPVARVSVRYFNEAVVGDVLTIRGWRSKPSSHFGFIIRRGDDILFKAQIATK